MEGFEASFKSGASGDFRFGPLTGKGSVMSGLYVRPRVWTLREPPRAYSSSKSTASSSPVSCSPDCDISFGEMRPSKPKSRSSHLLRESSSPRSG